MMLSIIIPTTGERPQFVEQAMRMISLQTIKSHIQEVKLIQNVAKDRNTLAENYRKGYTEAEGDLVVFWEDDDYYFPHYLETMVKNFETNIDVLGTDSTIYYHIGIRKWVRIPHKRHSSAMNMVLRAGLRDIPWSPLSDPFLDLRIWKQVAKGQLRGKLISDTISIGIKHGVGRCGGRGHLVEFPYKHEDPDLFYLNTHVQDLEIRKFYANFIHLQREKATV